MMKKLLLLLVTHGIVGAIGFGAGIYVLPILTAPEAPAVAEVEAIAAQAVFNGEFKRDLQDSDALHWGEGKLAVGTKSISLMGKLAPGPDYILYLASEFVETEADFKRLKDTMAPVGSVKTFENFVVSVPEGVDPAAYNTAIVWCESFGQFITAAQYQ